MPAGQSAQHRNDIMRSKVQMASQPSCRIENSMPCISSIVFIRCCASTKSRVMSIVLNFSSFSKGKPTASTDTERQPNARFDAFKGFFIMELALKWFIVGLVNASEMLSMDSMCRIRSHCACIEQFMGPDNKRKWMETKCKHVYYRNSVSGWSADQTKGCLIFTRWCCR